MSEPLKGFVFGLLFDFEDERNRTFTCHHCSEKKVLPKDAVYVNSDGAAKLRDQHYKPCDKCGKDVMEFLAFCKRYGLGPDPPPVPRKKRWKQKDVFDFAAAGYINCHKKEG